MKSDLSLNKEEFGLFSDTKLKVVLNAVLNNAPLIPLPGSHDQPRQAHMHHVTITEQPAVLLNCGEHKKNKTQEPALN